MECGSYLKIERVVRYEENGCTNKAYVCDMNEWMLRGLLFSALLCHQIQETNAFFTAIKMYVYER